MRSLSFSRSGEEHQRTRRLLLPALHGRRMRARAAVMDRAARTESARWRPGDRIALSAAARSIALRIIVLAIFGVENELRMTNSPTWPPV